MTRLDMNLDSTSPSGMAVGFWRRQFMPTTTRAQIIFDLLFGIVSPVLCFVYDPIVFKSDFGDGLFVEYQSFAYIVSVVEILLLIMWLVCGRQLEPRTQLLGGMLLAGALFSGVIGLAILPFTLLGLFLGIGILGFIPFCTALVYLRNARSAFQLSRNHFPRRSRIASTIIGCALVLAPAAGLNLAASMFVSQSMDAVLYADPQVADLAVDGVKSLGFLARPDLSRLVSAYAEAKDQPRKEELKRRYKRLTGSDIEERLRILAD